LYNVCRPTLIDHASNKNFLLVGRSALTTGHSRSGVGRAIAGVTAMSHLRPWAILA
jgi:hypothetical protein